MIALFGFWEWRSAAMLALSIPITLCMTYGFMHLVGMDLQQVSVASLIIALGLLVDDPVVAGDAIKRELGHGLWLIAEYRPGNNEYKFYVSDLAATTTKHELVRIVKLRWRVERDYQELKGEIGLGHFEGRTWRGFHATPPCAPLAHAFLALQRRLFPPEVLSLDFADGTPPHPAAPVAAHRHLPAVPPLV